MVNNRKVADAFNAHQGYNDKNHGPAAEMVYRLLTVPMDYTTFASTNPTSKDQSVEQDLNIEYVSLSPRQGYFNIKTNLLLRSTTICKPRTTVKAPLENFRI